MMTLLRQAGYNPTYPKMSDHFHAIAKEKSPMKKKSWISKAIK